MAICHCCANRTEIAAIFRSAQSSLTMSNLSSGDANLVDVANTSSRTGAHFDGANETPNAVGLGLQTMDKIDLLACRSDLSAKTSRRTVLFMQYALFVARLRALLETARISALAVQRPLSSAAPCKLQLVLIDMRDIEAVHSFAT